ncbi:MAG TPA: sulfotransferase [Rhizomicrobium sp.]
MNSETGTENSTVSYEAALALHMRGRVGEAEHMYEAFLKSHPDHSEAWHGLGIIRLRSGRTDTAIDNLRKAVAAGGSAVVKNNLGVALCAAQRFAEAADVYRAVVQSDPDAVSSLGNLGQVLNQLRAFAEAVEVLQKGLRLAPDNARLHNQLAIALAECRRLDEAQAHFEKAVALDPGRSEFHCDLGALLLKRDRIRQAAECYRRALSVTPASPMALCGLGEALGGLNRHEEAVACFRQAVALAPGYAAAHYNCGTALTYLGRMAEAETAFVRAAELEPDNPAYRGALIAMKKTTASSAHLKALQALAIDADRLGEREAMELQFTLAKAYDDIGDHARAFEALRLGNAAKRRQNPYELQQDLDRFRAIADAFTAELLAAHAGQGDPTEVPVFVVGMPRSGTTLVEQILASHPDVFGAGELTILPDLISSGRAGGDFPAAVATLGAEAWRAIGETYAGTLRAQAAEAVRITDKLPLNFQLVGLIRLALPKARIIHVMRDPLDTCFSCYFTLFAHELGFSDDLADLGRYYRGYQSLMAHWRSVLLEGAMLEIQYENLVADLETEARRLIGYCGLPWDARCLDFHNTVRPVETASMLQVRRPLFQTSVGRAGPYRPWLAPLERALAGET